MLMGSLRSHIIPFKTKGLGSWNTCVAKGKHKYTHHSTTHTHTSAIDLIYFIPHYYYSNYYYYYDGLFCAEIKNKLDQKKWCVYVLLDDVYTCAYLCNTSIP